MKIPDGYKTFSSFEEKREYYYNWEFKSRKKDELKKLVYKGVYTDDPYEHPEECEIIGYYDDTRLLIELQNSKEQVVIHRADRKQMQSKHFRQNQPEGNNDAEETPGKMLNTLPEEYIVYDIETTGRSYTDDEIIEISALKVVNGNVKETFDSFIHIDFPLSKAISRLTGIENDILISAPEPDQVMSEFKDFIGDSILVGHNIRTFDNYFVQNSYKKAGLGTLTNDYVDTLVIAKRLLIESRHHTLSDLVDHYNIENDKPFHRSIHDCYYNFKCYEAKRKQIIDEYGNVDTFYSKPTRKSGMEKPSQKNKRSSIMPYPKYSDLRKLESQNDNYDVDNPFYKKSCVFTGELSRYSREEAAQLIVNKGGSCENNVTKKTNYLIIGNNDYCASIKDGKSAKQKKAEEYKLTGQDIEIIPESVFYAMINEN